MIRALPHLLYCPYILYSYCYPLPEPAVRPWNFRLSAGYLSLPPHSPLKLFHHFWHILKYFLCRHFLRLCCHMLTVAGKADRCGLHRQVFSADSIIVNSVSTAAHHMLYPAFHPAGYFLLRCYHLQINLLSVYRNQQSSAHRIHSPSRSHFSPLLWQLCPLRYPPRKAASPFLPYRPASH